MKFVGILAVFVATIGGFFLAGGKMKVITGIILPSMLGEATIILGLAVAAFIISNSTHAIKHTLSYFSALKKPAAYSKNDYMELLSMLFSVFKLARTKGWLALEAHIENPDNSTLFANFPSFAHNHHALASKIFQAMHPIINAFTIKLANVGKVVTTRNVRAHTKA